MARHELADQVAVLLRRVYPSELDKDELIEQAGLSPADLRGALDSLREEGELDEAGDEYRWKDPEGGAEPPEEVLEDDDDADDRPGPEFVSELSKVGNRSARLVLQVIGNFDPPSDSDTATGDKALVIATEVQNVLGSALGGIGFVVDIKRIEVYDEPRVLYDAEGAESEDEPDQQ